MAPQVNAVGCRHGLISFSRSGHASYSATVDATYATIPHDLLSLIGIAQLLGVDFLPITWQPALSELGQGASSQVSQALVNLRTSFAFKRFKWPSRDQQPAFWRALVSEVSILGIPALRDHGHIARLEGICWERSPSEGRVWPVLIFEKTSLGDLENFLRCPTGRNLSFSDRLRLCTDVAIAIRDLNHCGKRDRPYFALLKLIINLGVIHGDIKPQNVLVFKDDSGHFRGKMTDFGYSTMANDASLIRMPRSEPWCAPEHHFGLVSRSSAIKMDLYSFGVLCVWAFLTDKDEMLEFDFIKRLKQGKGLLSFVQQFLQTRSQWLSQDENFLRSLFSATLPHEMSERCLDFIEVIRILSSEWYGATSSELDALNLSLMSTASLLLRESNEMTSLIPIHRKRQSSEQVSSSTFQIYMADPKFREFLPMLFQHRIQTASKGVPYSGRSQDAALQLACCYALGLGVKRDNLMIKAVLRGTQYTERDVQIELRLISEQQTRLAFREGKFRELLEQGMINIFDTALRPRAEPDLIQTESSYRQEIPELEAALGDKHTLVLELKLRLALTLHDQGQFEDARKLSQTVLDVRKATCSELHIGVLDAKLHLSSVLHSQTNYADAKALLHEVSQGFKDTFGEEHPHTQTALMRLARTLNAQGEFKEAEQSYRKVLLARVNTLGPEHPETLSVMHDLALALAHQSQLAEAETMARDATEGRELALGAEHPDTLASMGNLASFLRDQGRHDEALELQAKVVTRQTKALGPNHPHTLSSKANLSVATAKKGNFPLAETLQREVCESVKSVLDPGHVDVTTAEHNLGTLLLAQGKSSEAENIFSRCIEAYSASLGPEHVHTLTAIWLRAQAIKSQNRLEESVKLYEIAYNGYVKALGAEHRTTVGCLNEYTKVLEAVRKATS